MKVFDVMEQQSEEWFKVRKGRPTASQFDQILTPTGALSKSRVGYIRKLVRECVVDDPMEFMGNKYTEWGNEYENEAREVFQQETGLAVKRVGFVTRNDEIVGCSPDGLIVDESGNYIAGLEIKCPQVDTHVETLIDGILPSKHKLQVHGGMAVTGLSAWWFMSYFPGLNPFILKVEMDDFTLKISEALNDFLIDYGKNREAILNKFVPKKSAVKSPTTLEEII